MLEDIATLTGGRAIFKDLGVQLENVQLRDLGRAKKVRVDAENTTITEGAGEKRAIDGRTEMIRREIEKTDSDYDREKLQERLAKLAGGVAQIKVGAATETEMKERKALYEDALHATRAALAEGIVPGGGVALLQARKVLDKVKLDGDEQLGVQVLQNVLEWPCRLIAENAGLDGSVVVNNIRRSKEKNHGYNAETGNYEDLRKAGIVDPVKVTRSALQNGASVACLLLTTESLVADIPEKKKEGGPPDHHGGMEAWVAWKAWVVWVAWAAWTCKSQICNPKFEIRNDGERPNTARLSSFEFRISNFGFNSEEPNHGKRERSSIEGSAA